MTAPSSCGEIDLKASLHRGPFHIYGLIVEDPQPDQESHSKRAGLDRPNAKSPDCRPVTAITRAGSLPFSPAPAIFQDYGESACLALVRPDVSEAVGP